MILTGPNAAGKTTLLKLRISNFNAAINFHCHYLTRQLVFEAFDKHFCSVDKILCIAHCAMGWNSFSRSIYASFM